MPNTLATLNGYLDTALRDTTDTTWTSGAKDNLITWAVAGLWPRISRELPSQANTITLVTDQFFYSLPVEMLALSRVDWVYTQSNERGPIIGWTTEGNPLLGALRLHVSPRIVNEGGTLRLLGYGRYGLTSATLATSAAADDIFDTSAAHTFTAGTTIRLNGLTGGTGLSETTPYYVISTNLASTTFQLSTTPGGTAVNFTTDVTAGTAYADLIPDDLVPLVIATATAKAYRDLGADRAQFRQWMDSGESDTSVNSLVMLINEADNEARTIRRQIKTWQRPVPGRVP